MSKQIHVHTSQYPLECFASIWLVASHCLCRLIWLTVSVATTISWIFLTMETVGDTSEDPFENFINDVPMTALCRRSKSTYGKCWVKRNFQNQCNRSTTS